MLKRFLNYIRRIFRCEKPSTIEEVPESHRIVFDGNELPFGDDEDSEIIMATPFVSAPISDCAGSVRCKEH